MGLVDFFMLLFAVITAVSTTAQTEAALENVFVYSRIRQHRCAHTNTRINMSGNKKL